MKIILGLLETIFYMVCTYIILSTACEYRMGRHWLLRAFYAKTPYQMLFTKMQLSKDIKSEDLGKLTYIGYVGILLSTVGIILLILYSAYQMWMGISFSWRFRIQLWAVCSFLWGVFSILFQILDSLLAWIIGLF